MEKEKNKAKVMSMVTLATRSDVPGFFDRPIKEERPNSNPSKVNGVNRNKATIQ